ncbi:MAG TPA: PGPGW domain-containing protein [Deltaproteobacteria bacterium]|nr:PGPGW domain-containing protein [Deltaproteobacteria bacterium]
MIEAALMWVSFHETLLKYLGASSLIALFLTLVVVIFLIIRMPADYFTYERNEIREYRKKYHPVVWMVLLPLKNVLGIAFILAGFAMLVLPGQGILTILIGLTLVDFPGKRKLECRIVGQKKVLSTINRVRALAGKPPLQLSRD